MSNNTDEVSWGKVFGVGVLIFVAVSVVFSLLGLALGWFNAGVEVVSPTNVKAQFAHAYTNYEALEATAVNVDTARSALCDTTQGTNAWDQRYTQFTAQVNNYQRIQADYEAAYDNAFQAKHVGPRDLPQDAPTLSAMMESQGLEPVGHPICSS